MHESSPARLTIDVVVPVHGGWPHVERCLASLEQQTVPLRVIVVDDLSPDDTLQRIRDRFTEFTIIANETNRGFAATCNAGISAGLGDIVMLLNSDVVANPDMTANVLAAFEGAPARLGSVAPLLLSPDGTVDSFGIAADPTLAGFVRFHGAEVRDADAAHPRVLGPYGAAAAYRRDALEDIGLLDDNIFMYGEELELALRLRAASWDSVAIPVVAGTHIGGASAGRESVRQRYLSGYGRGYTLRVYGVLRTRQAARTLLVEAIVTVARLILRRDVASLRGRLAGWRAGAGVPKRTIPSDGVDNGIDLRRSLRMRSDDYWVSPRP